MLFFIFKHPMDASDEFLVSAVWELGDLQEQNHYNVQHTDSINASNEQVETYSK